MKKKTIQERLQELATGDVQRTKAGRFRDIYPDVESAIASGVSHEVILEVLKEGGLEMTLATFRSTLQRTRAKRPKSSLKAGSKPARLQAPGGLQQSREAEPPVAPEPDPVASHDPKDIDKIIGEKPDLDALAKLGRSIKK
jgi:hypothetical protein